MSADDELANEEKRALRQLLESRGWSILRRTLEEGYRAREQHILLTPLSETFTSFQQEFMKGEASILRLILAMPQMTIEALEEEDTDDDRNARAEPDTAEPELGSDGWPVGSAP